jgi:hypothetical protein
VTVIPRRAAASATGGITASQVSRSTWDERFHALGIFGPLPPDADHLDEKAVHTQFTSSAGMRCR